MPERAQQRRQLRHRRLTLSHQEHRERSDATCRRIIGQSVYRKSRRIALYLPADGEIDTHAIVQHAWALHKQVYLPVLTPFLDNRLWFARYEPQTRLVSNRFGIAEPEYIHRQRVAAHALDLVLTPLVGFDKKGNRLGMGGGFYDRSFAFLHHRRVWQKPRLVGLAYEFQQLPSLPAHPWDVPLTAVATETDWHVF